MKYISFLSILAVLLTFSCSDKKSQDAVKMPTPLVVTADAVARDFPVILSGVGTVEGYRNVEIKPMINGQILKVHFTQGQDVAKGFLLFSLDPRSYKAALEVARGNLLKDTVNMENAQREAKRYEGLYEKELASKSQYEQMATNAKSTAAQVEADKAAVENAKVSLSYCSIYAPIPGRTGNLIFFDGSMVTTLDTRPMLVINQIQPIYVTFTLPSQYLNRIRDNMVHGRLVVEAVTSDSQGQRETGVLTFINNIIDVTTGTIALKGEFENKDKRLWPGQFVNVNLMLETLKGAVVVPSQAVLTGRQGQFVYIVKGDQSVAVSQVKTGVTYMGETVIESGVNAGDKVVTDGQLRLMPGVKVRLKGAEAASGMKVPNDGQKEHKN